MIKIPEHMIYKVDGNNEIIYLKQYIVLDLRKINKNIWQWIEKKLLVWWFYLNLNVILMYFIFSNENLLTKAHLSFY